MTGGEAHRQAGEAADDDNAQSLRDEGGNNLRTRCADGEAEAHLAAAHATEIVERAVEAEASERDCGPGEEGEEGGAQTILGKRVADVIGEGRDAEDGARWLGLVKLDAEGLGQRHGRAVSADEEPG